MKIAFFDTHKFEQPYFEAANKQLGFEISFFKTHLSEESCELANNHDVVCVFVNDTLNENVLKKLASYGIKLIALRSAGYNHVDLVAAKQLNLPVVRVPSYSPHAVAEHAVALLLALNRKTHKAYDRVKEMNFSLNNLVGFDLHRKTVGVIGTGNIGEVFCKIMHGFGCKIIAFDPIQKSSLKECYGVTYCSFEDVLKNSDVLSLHAPLTPLTRHLINHKNIFTLKKNVFLINTSRGALIETSALIKALKSQHIGAAGLDVYEEEEKVFFEDHSNEILDDDLLARLITFPNVIITAHQAFLTHEALTNIAETTLENISSYAKKQPLKNAVT